LKYPYAKTGKRFNLYKNKLRKRGTYTVFEAPLPRISLYWTQKNKTKKLKMMRKKLKKRE